MSDHTDVLRRAQAHTDAAAMLLKVAAEEIQTQTINRFMRSINYWLCSKRDDVERLSAWIEDHVTGSDLFCQHGQPPHIVNARLCERCESTRRRKVVNASDDVRREIQRSIIEEMRDLAKRVRKRDDEQDAPYEASAQSDADFLESVADMLLSEMRDQVTVDITPQDGAARVAAERMRQIKVEGWTPDHDDEQDEGEIAWAAVCYAAPGPVLTSHGFDTALGTRAGAAISFSDPWPWARGWDKRSKAQPTRLERIRELEKAGALVCAEIDRLLRAEADDPTEQPEA